MGRGLPGGRALALKAVLEQGMAARIDRHLEEMAERGEADRRNGSYGRWLMTELGEIELRVPRTRRFSRLGVVRGLCAAGGTNRPDDARWFAFYDRGRPHSALGGPPQPRPTKKECCRRCRPSAKFRIVILFLDRCHITN